MQKLYETHVPSDGKELLTLRGHGEWIYSVAFSPDGQRIVTGSYDKTAKVWDSVGGKELLTLRGHGDRVVSVAFSPEGLRLVTGSMDGTSRVWEAATVEQVAAWQLEENANNQRWAQILAAAKIKPKADAE